MEKHDHVRKRNIGRRLLIPAAAALILGACGGGSGPSSQGAAAAQSEATEVSIEGLTFEPGRLEVDAGTTVTWTNEDDVMHTVTSGIQGEQGAPGVTEDQPAKPDGVFDEELAEQGATFTFTFDKAGTYQYFCDIHRQMTGEIVVN